MTPMAPSTCTCHTHLLRPSRTLPFSTAAGSRSQRLRRLDVTAAAHKQTLGDVLKVRSCRMVDACLPAADIILQSTAGSDAVILIRNLHTELLPVKQ